MAVVKNVMTIKLWQPVFSYSKEDFTKYQRNTSERKEFKEENKKNKKAD